MDKRHSGMERRSWRCMCASAFMLRPSISLPVSLSHLSAFQLQTVPNVDVYHNEKGCLVCARARVRFVCLLGCARTRMCVTCVVMNKDVLCVELVVNHWQCWQLTDKQIDPRPPREHCLAPAHSSHTRTHAHTKACVYAHARACAARGPARVFELRIISDHSC